MKLRWLLLVICLSGAASRAAEGEPAESQATQANATEGQASASQAADSQAADSQDEENQAADVQDESANPSSKQNSSEFPAEIQAILDSQAEYGTTEKCISLGRIRSVRVLDDKHITFQVSRDRYYLVQLKQRCPGLRRDSKISYETNGTGVCEWDYIRAVYEFGPGNHQLGPACKIPGFLEVTKEQVFILRDALKPKKG